MNSAFSSPVEQNLATPNRICKKTITTRQEKIQDILAQIKNFEQLPCPLITKSDVTRGEKIEKIFADNEIDSERGIIIRLIQKAANNLYDYALFLEDVFQQIDLAKSKRPDGPYPDMLILCDIPSRVADDLNDLRLFFHQNFCFFRHKLNSALRDLSERWTLLSRHLPVINKKVDLAYQYLSSQKHDTQNLRQTKLPSAVMAIARQDYLKQSRNLKFGHIFSQLKTEMETVSIPEITKKFNQANKIMKFRRREFIQIILHCLQHNEKQTITQLLDEIIASQDNLSTIDASKKP